VPLGLPPRAWELLFKAGPQEVYQRVDHPRAAENRARAASRLRGLGAVVPAEPEPHALDRVAVEVGAAAWLAGSWQRRTLARAESSLAHSDPATQARGLRERGLLMYQAGLAPRAAPDLERAAALEPDDGRTWYYLAFNRVLLGDRAGALESFRRLAELPADRLTPEQRRRAAHVTRVLMAMDDGRRAGPSR
jgi:Flp pilus assembly protein TadD